MSLPTREAIEIDTGVVEVAGVNHISGARLINATKGVVDRARRAGQRIELTQDAVASIIGEILHDAYGAARSRPAA